MKRELMHDPTFLGQASEPATAADIAVAMDLLDTLRAHHETCVGMAANMIGVRKRIIAFCDDTAPLLPWTLMLNPEILEKSEPYDAAEGCLSLLGGPRPCKRYRRITVRYQDMQMKVHTKDYQDFTAQIIQHEIDHCNGVLI